MFFKALKEEGTENGMKMNILEYCEYGSRRFILRGLDASVIPRKGERIKLETLNDGVEPYTVMEVLWGIGSNIEVNVAVRTDEEIERMELRG